MPPARQWAFGWAESGQMAEGWPEELRRSAASCQQSQQADRWACGPVRSHDKQSTNLALATGTGKAQLNAGLKGDN